MSFPLSLVELRSRYHDRLRPKRTSNRILSMDSRSWRHFPRVMPANDRAPGGGFERYEGVDRFGRAVDLIYEDFADDGLAGYRTGRVVDVSGFDYHNLDPQSSNFVSGNNRGPGYGRSFGNGRLDRLPQQYNLANHLRTLRVRPRIGCHAMEPMKFGKAMRELHRTVKKADEFYTTFITEYDSDVAQTKKYATASILDQIWTMKVTGEKDHQTQQQSENLYETNDTMTELRREFEEMKEKVRDAIQSAIDSKLPDPGHSNKIQIHAENAERLLGKIETAHSQIVDLLDRASEAREYCQSLTQELKLLMQLVDPADTNNKVLFRDGGFDRAGSGDDGDNAGGGGGAADAAGPRHW